MNKNGTLLVKGRSGLGNRILAALTGMLYVRLTGRELIVDWRDGIYSKDEENVFPLLYECFRARPVAEIPATESVAPGAWRGRLGLSVLELQELYPGIEYDDLRRTSSMDPTNLAHSEELVVLWHLGPRVEAIVRTNRERVAGVFGRLQPHELLRTIAAEDLVLAPALRERVERFSAEHFEGEVVGVHVRYSDKRVAFDAIRRRLESLLERRPGISIFLATDNSDVRDLFCRSYRPVFTTAHWYPPPGVSSHLDASVPDRLENAREGLVDLYLLAACDHLVVDTSSSFARVAWLLSNRGREGLRDVRRTATLRRRLRGIRRRFRPFGSEPCGPW